MTEGEQMLEIVRSVEVEMNTRALHVDDADLRQRQPPPVSVRTAIPERRSDRIRRMQQQRVRPAPMPVRSDNRGVRVRSPDQGLDVIRGQQWQVRQDGQ